VSDRYWNFIADGHVHLYPTVPLDGLLDIVSGNISQLQSRPDPNHLAVLVVADPEGVQGYERLQRYHIEQQALRADASWLQEADDECSFILRRDLGMRILVIRGQQLITREGLEVLGAGYAGDIPSGLTLRQTIDRISTAGGWSTIAWGVAKWLGKRGRIVSDLIASEAGREDVFLGDNGGRPKWWSLVRQFEQATERGMRILAGTDPLPLNGEARRIASYGFRIHGDRTDGESILTAFRRALCIQREPVLTLGQRMGSSRFISNQLGLRLQRL
jgi:hypothetical protein